MFSTWLLWFCVLLIAACTGLEQSVRIQRIERSLMVAPSISEQEQAALLELAFALAYWKLNVIAPIHAQNTEWNKFCESLVGMAQKASIPIRLGDLQTTVGHKQSEQVIKSIIAEIEKSQGQQASLLFIVYYYPYLSLHVLPVLGDTLGKPIEGMGQTAAREYMMAAVEAARRAGVKGQLLSDGYTIVAELASQESLLIDEVSQEIRTWSSAVSYAMLGKPTPAPMPLVTPVPTLSAAEVVGTDITIRLPEGNAQRGEKLVLTSGCIGCHNAQASGPTWLNQDSSPSENLSERAKTKLASPDYTGEAKTVEQYLLESIVHPDVYVVPGYSAGICPEYGSKLTKQEAADIITYLLTLK